MNDEWSHKYGLWLYVMHMLTFLLIISSGTTSWYRMVCSSIDRSIDAMKSVTLTMLSQFFNLAWKVNADEQCCLPASTFFCVSLLLVMLCCRRCLLSAVLFLLSSASSRSVIWSFTFSASSTYTCCYARRSVLFESLNVSRYKFVHTVHNSLR